MHTVPDINFNKIKMRIITIYTMNAALSKPYPVRTSACARKGPTYFLRLTISSPP